MMMSPFTSKAILLGQLKAAEVLKPFENPIELPASVDTFQ